MEIVNAIIGGIRSVIGAICEALESIVSFLNPFSDEDIEDALKEESSDDEVGKYEGE